MLSVILLSMRMIILPTLNLIKHLICADLWQQLELASELEPDLRDTVDWGRKWHVDFNARKTEPVSFNLSKNAGAIDVKMDGSVLEEKPSFKMLGLIFISKLDLGSYIILTAKSANKKIGALIRSMNFLSPEVAMYIYKYTIRPCMEHLSCLGWCSGIIGYATKTNMQDCWSFTCCLSWNLGLSSKCSQLKSFL